MAFSGLSRINQNISNETKNSVIPESQKTVIMSIKTSAGELVVEIPNDDNHKSYIKNFLSLSREKYYNGQTGIIQENNYFEFGDPYSKYKESDESWGVGGPGYKYPRDEKILTTQGDYDVGLVVLPDGNLHGGILRIYGKQMRIESIYKLGELVSGHDILDNHLKYQKTLSINSVSMQ